MCTKEEIILIIIVPNEKFWSTNSNKWNWMTQTTMENSVKEEGGEKLERDRMDHPSWIKLAAGRMLVKPWNYHFFEPRALDAFSNLPSSSRHVPMFPLFYPLSKEAPTFSPSRDETKFIFLLPLLTNRIREKIPERGGCIFENIITNIFETFKDLQERLELGFGRGED